MGCLSFCPLDFSIEVISDAFKGQVSRFTSLATPLIVIPLGCIDDHAAAPNDLRHPHGRVCGGPPRPFVEDKDTGGGRKIRILISHRVHRLRICIPCFFLTRRRIGATVTRSLQVCSSGICGSLMRNSHHSVVSRSLQGHRACEQRPVRDRLTYCHRSHVLSLLPLRASSCKMRRLQPDNVWTSVMHCPSICA